MTDLSRLWEPLDIGTSRVPNRIFMAAHSAGMAPDQYADYLGARARGGTGMIVTGAIPVHPTTTHAGAVPWRGWDPSVIEELRPPIMEVHRHDRPIIVQLFHVGVNRRAIGPWAPMWAPSPLPSPRRGVIPKAMEPGDIAELVEGFALSARHAQQAGADGVEIHGAHGYLLSAFLSPYWNRRTDAYGGGAEGRTRLVLEVATAVRERCGPDLVVGLKLNFDEFIGESGIVPAVAEETLRILHMAGLFDYFSISCADYHTLHYLIAPESSGLSRHTAEHGALAKGVVGNEVPILVTGAIRTVEEAAEVVGSGQADMVGMVRAHLADPDLVRKARNGGGVAVRRCVGANQGCWRRLVSSVVVSCTVNPVVGREREWDEEAPPISDPKRILVIGGGPAGLKFADTAARLGHQVTLMEREEELGGQLRFAARLPYRAAWANIAADLGQAIHQRGVEVRLGADADAERVVDFGADLSVVATGSTWDTSGFSVHQLDRNGIPRTAGARVIDPLAAIDAPGACGAAAVIVDDNGNYAPLGLAELLAGESIAVTMVTAAPALGGALVDTLDYDWVYPRLMTAGVRAVTSARVESIARGRVTVRSLWGGHESEIAADTVVLAMMRKSNDALYHTLSERGVNVVRIGDCVAPREVDDAIREGVHEAWEVSRASARSA